MADAEVKDMKTIIFFSNTSDNHLRAAETLVEAIKADERCNHVLYFRPLMQNVYQVIRGAKAEDGEITLIGCHEIIFVPGHRTELMDRIESTKNVILKINSMCFVGDNDKKKRKVKKVIDWLLEETEEIEL